MTTKSILKEAISKKQTISFKYGNLSRTVEPHHYGISNKTEQLHGYQTSGESNSGKLPQWRNFKLKNITNLSLNKTIFTPQPTYNPSNSKYQTIMEQIDTDLSDKNINSPSFKR